MNLVISPQAYSRWTVPYIIEDIREFPAPSRRNCQKLSAVAISVFLEGKLERPNNNVIGEAVRALRRVAIEGVTPEVDGGRFAIKRTIGDMVQVRADIYADGHDALGAALLYRRCEQGRCEEAQAMSGAGAKRK